MIKWTILPALLVIALYVAVVAVGGAREALRRSD